MSSNNDIYIDENEDNIGNKTFNTVLLVFYIIMKYPIKYYLLFSLIKIIYYLYKSAYLFFCKSRKKLMKGFFSIIEVKDMNLIVFKVPDIFTIFRGFMTIFIGLLYLLVAVGYFICACILMLPFNFVFSY